MLCHVMMLWLVVGLQKDFSTITYVIAGDDTAPMYFAVNPESGQITTKASLENDDIETYRVNKTRSYK